MPYPLLLHSKHCEAPVTYEPFGEWLVPWRFDSLETEYRALRTGAGLIDYSTQAIIEVRGADRADFLHNLLSNDIKRLTAGQGCRAALLTAGAKLLAELLVVADADTLWLLCDANRAPMVLQTLEQYRFSEEVTLTNHERRSAVLALQGPRTLEMLSTLVGARSDLQHPGDHVVCSFHDVPLRIIRHTLTGEAGALCLCPAEQAHRMWSQLAGQKGATLVGWEALNTARIEAGIPWYGIDMDESALLPETGLEAQLASDTKGCYVGQEIVARMQTYGSASRKLVGLRFDGDQVPGPGDALEQDGKEAGKVTSACFSPTRKQPIGFGWVKRGFYGPGTQLELLRWGIRLPVTVAARPLVP
ncbi:MAG: aminomethyl transferase family protein [Candidatus Omnitrophica bacterium]|nr:aminomethyl transferase family protein [Candidatus Omnitrophota bacterium]